MAETITTLAGKLVVQSQPESAGIFFVYRQLEDGRLLETQLTDSEWHTLLNADKVKRNERVDELNKHPLNVAALELLCRAKRGPGNVGEMRWLHVLSLAAIGLEDDEDWNSDSRLRFADRMRGASRKWKVHLPAWRKRR